MDNKPVAAATNPRIKGVIVDYNDKQGFGKILTDSDEFYFFSRHHMLRGVPKVGANVTFIVSPKPVPDGFLKYSMLVCVVEPESAGQAALAQPLEQPAVDGQKADS